MPKKSLLIVLFLLLNSACASDYYADYYTHNAGYYANYYPQDTLFRAHVSNGIGPDSLYIFPINEFHDFSEDLRYIDVTWPYQLAGTILKGFLGTR